MLLLVLILVLVAFGLLVVALLASSVLWAWVSVVMSVAAASALLVDWLQRRSAVRDETEDGVAAPADLEVHPVADIEPVTELIPVVRPSDSTPDGSIGNGVTAGYSGDIRSAAFLDPRFDPAGDVERTVVMPIVRPSGSAERPSGAMGGTASIAEDSSPSVTFPTPEESVYEPGLNGERVVHDRGAATTEATDAAERADEGQTVTGVGSIPGSGSGTGRGAVSGSSAVSGFGSESGFGTGSGSGSSAVSGGDTDTDSGSGSGAGLAPVSGSEAGSVSPQNGAAAGMAAAMGPTSESASRSEGAGPAPVAARSDSDPDPASIPDAGQGTAENDDGGEEPTAIVRNSRGAVAEQPGMFRALPDRAGNDLGVDPEATMIVRSVTPAAVPLPPAGPDGEPPEERRDASIAEIIARLEDEVVVVDERPRYHLPTCPSVAANPLISLPVREAVEYGFTPCGWCVPDRTLGDRRRTTAR